METLTLVDGYDRSKNPAKALYRRMTIAEAKALRPGQRAPIYCPLEGSARTVTVNGAPKTWKRSPGRVAVPVKYGLYRYATLESSGGLDAPMDRLLVKLEQLPSAD